MTRLIIDTPTGSNLDPALHDTIDEAGLEARDFRVLGAVLRWAGRRRSYRASVEGLARTCQISESSARRALQTLVNGGWLDAITRTGRTTEYQPTTRLHWDGGLAYFVPGPLDELGLTPLEWRAYYHCVRRADATGFCTLNISDAARTCCTSRERFAERLRCLTACGLLQQADGHAYHLTPRTTWATSETLPLIRDALSRGDTPPCPEVTPPLSRGDTPPCPEVTPMVNPLVVNPLVKDNEIFFDKNSRAFFQSLFTGKLQRVEDYIKREYQADPTALYTTWLKQFGTNPLREAWTIIRDTKTALDVNPKMKGYAKNLRFIKFCQGELNGREDPAHLCALHTRATSPAPKVLEPLPVRSAPPKPLPVPPSLARRRERDARIAAERAA